MTRIAFDMSSVIWTCLSAGKDVEAKRVEHNGRIMPVNTAAYGYENAVNHIVATLKNCGLVPRNMIMVFEGIDSKAPRLAIANTYKARRGNRPLEAYAEFQILGDMLKDVFGKLGACAVTQDKAEGDDTLGYLALNSEEDLFISTNDGDMTVLNGTNKYGAKITVLVNGVLGENKYGDFPMQFVTVYKALVGDSSDSITGIKGFGEVAWKAFFDEFGVDGLAELDRMAKTGSLDGLLDDLDNKMALKIYEGREQFLQSYALAKVYPEWVNTLHHPLKFQPGLIRGEVTDERLVQWSCTARLITLDKWESWTKNAFKDLCYSEYVALDIETSTPDESDDWLAAQGKEDNAGVDVIGSKLTGMSLTYGENLQHTVYIPVDHKDTVNVPSDVLKDYIKNICDAGVQLIIQNYSFEGTVLYSEWASEDIVWKANGYEGLLPNCLDTKLEASYVDENDSLGLKKLSKKWFNYDQVDYKAVTSIDGVQYKMNELTGAHVKDYGCDDTIVTASLHNFFKLFMGLEHTWQVYLDVEIDAMYLHTQSFIHGTKCDVAKSKELEAIDDQTFNDAEKILEAYLVTKGWSGTVAPTYSIESTPAQLKESFQIVYGKELDTAVRKIDRIAAAMAEQGGLNMADFLVNSDWQGLTDFVRSKWTAKPIFNTGSPKQMCDLMYTTMGLPIRVYNKPTPVMRKAGIRQGNPQANALAFSYAFAMDATDETKPVLQALQLMKMVETRRGLYYKPYPYFVHWKTGRIHSSHNQCATNTRRASSSAPNTQQMPKHPKIEGQAARFREVFVPHKKNAVIVSMDFEAQELRVIADYSRDQNMLDCFIGDNLKDMHALTGLGIARSKDSEMSWSYEMFMAALGDKAHPQHKFIKECRTRGKKVNFTTEYGAMAPKVAMTLLVSEEDAQAFIDAKEHAFPRSLEWKQEVIADAKLYGYVKTKMGAVRHLQPALTSSDRYENSKAERQAVNTKIQGSSAEMTKRAEGRMFKARLEQLFDCEIIGPVHDEVLASVAIDDLYGLLPAMHRCMVAPYADMVVPIGSSISFGPSFGVQIEIGNVPSKEAIDSGLATLKEAA
jgi:DNA polymerase I-like protein with 3'-5' exonuclease and polymerase domains/5'-3' exonuclease